MRSSLRHQWKQSLLISMCREYFHSHDYNSEVIYIMRTPDSDTACTVLFIRWHRSLTQCHSLTTIVNSSQGPFPTSGRYFHGWNFRKRAGEHWRSWPYSTNQQCQYISPCGCCGFGSNWSQNDSRSTTPDPLLTKQDLHRWEAACWQRLHCFCCRVHPGTYQKLCWQRVRTSMLQIWSELITLYSQLEDCILERSSIPGVPWTPKQFLVDLFRRRKNSGKWK